MHHMRGVADEQIGVTVDCRSESHLIVAGLLDCRSQHHVIIDDPADTERWQRIASREYAASIPNGTRNCPNQPFLTYRLA